MTRPLFDPDKMAAPSAPPPSDAPITVTQAAALVSGALERSLPGRLRVIGEISGFNDRTHWYFRLKDESAVLDCVMFAAAARRVEPAPPGGRDGQRVVLSGRIEFYAKQGRTQFYAESMEAIGQGALEQRFRALCAELKSLGWFDAERKRPLPTFPRRIAVVTSRTGAALQDVIVTMKRRCPAVDIATVDVRVQGEAAAADIASAIRWISSGAAAFGIDAILLTRGGGSIEDLWAFNERAVAHAVLDAGIPVVAAIGHETDTTIAELVADLRCATPTQAAMMLTPDREALAEEVDQHARRLRLALSRTLERRGESARGLRIRLEHAAQRRTARAHIRLERLTARLATLKPAAVLAARRARANDLADRLDRAALLALERRRGRLDALERELILTGPASVLQRGYSVTLDGEGRIIRSAANVSDGSRITTRVADGSFDSIVAGRGPERGVLPIAKPQPLPSRRRRPRPDRPDQMHLF